MRLVLGLCEHDLHRADDAARVFRDKQHAISGFGLLRDAAPEIRRRREWQRMHETHRGATLDAIDEYIGQLIDLPRRERPRRPDRKLMCRHIPPLAASKRASTTT